MRKSRWLALVVLICVVPRIVMADRVVLKDGTAVTGTVANRNEIAESPANQVVVSILVQTDDGSTILDRYEIEDVDYIVLEDSEGKRVLDITALKTRADADEWEGRVPGYGERDNSRVFGILSTVTGAAIVTVGLAHKFGGPKCSITESDVSCDEDSYDSTNYFLIGIGAVFILGGVVELAKVDGEPRAQVGFLANEHGEYLVLGCRF